MKKLSVYQLGLKVGLTIFTYVVCHKLYTYVCIAADAVTNVKLVATKSPETFISAQDPSP